MAHAPEHLAHLEWLGYVQPVGVVVSIPALLAAQAQINRHIAPDQQRLLTCLPRDTDDNLSPEIRDFAGFTEQVLGWESTDLIPLPETAALPAELAALEVTLPEYHETLRPTYGVREFAPQEGQSPWLLLIQCQPVDTALDAPLADSDRSWHASPHAKFERLLRETSVPIGLLCNGTHLRLVYAPRGETSGFMTFAVAEMIQVAGRPIFAGMHLLLAAERLFSLPAPQRLPAMLAESRKYQNTVSTQLAEQVLAALYELLRGLQAADDQRHGALLRDVLAEAPNQVYAGLLTVLMRLVFVLYAEDRGLLPGDPLYANSYAVTGLFERLRTDAARFPDTMDLRYGAWAQLLTLFRLIHDGGRHGAMRIPARQGYLFDPDRYPFLEGRPHSSQPGEAVTFDIPHIADGVIVRVLTNLLILDGERLSYRTLDVEQIGSVYETMMGFNLEVAEGQSIAIKPTKAHGAPTTINLEALLATRGADRGKWLTEQTEQKLTGQAADALKNASSIDEVLTALDRRIAKHVTPYVVPAGSMVLQPSDERRRSGSHYTPRSLTAPIVRTTLQPILARLGDRPTPEQILDLKVCDPAMGSGAFLVEACRLLGDDLVKAWHVHDCVPGIPPDEDELLHARRLVAQRCLYGVDKNPMAVDLAKLSLWLVTLAKDHPFTFLDHTLRCGDSLVGLTQAQIAAFHWRPPQKHAAQDVWFGDPIAEQMQRVSAYRQRILAARDDKPYEQLRQELGVADDALSLVKLTGNLVIAAFFSTSKDRERTERLNTLARQLVKYIDNQERIEDVLPLEDAANELRAGDQPIEPFHWQIEFPEVFGRENQGFDAIIGNPPFLGGTRISNVCGLTYFQWLKETYPPGGHLCDMVAYFFRQCFKLLNSIGTMGLVATNTIAQGDTRNGGLAAICNSGGVIYNATRRYIWPGQVSVVVSVVHMAKGLQVRDKYLDGKLVDSITAYLFHAGGHDDPKRLAGRNQMFSAGSKIYSQGFLFADDDDEATPLSERERILQLNPAASERILPYMGGSELNSHPTQSPHRYVIYFSDLEDEGDLLPWPYLAEIVRNKVKPGRDRLGDNANNIPLKRRWWAYQAHRPKLYAVMATMERVLIASQVTPHMAFAFHSTGVVFSHKLNVFLFDQFESFGILQSRLHEIWARFFSSTSLELLSYTPSDCFETFPFPEHYGTNKRLEAVSKEYYDFRAQLMIVNNEGLTKTYNRFHDPYEQAPEIKKLRELHDAMDCAVLAAYGWTDLVPACEFLLDYEEGEDDEGESSRRKKPWRYRWPDDVRDDVLGRLLELNTQRAAQEHLTGLTADADVTTRGSRRRSPAQGATQTQRQPRGQRHQPALGLFERSESGSVLKVEMAILDRQSKGKAVNE